MNAHSKDEAVRAIFQTEGVRESPSVKSLTRLLRVVVGCLPRPGRGALDHAHVVSQELRRFVARDLVLGVDAGRAFHPFGLAAFATLKELRLTSDALPIAWWVAVLVAWP